MKLLITILAVLVALPSAFGQTSGGGTGGTTGGSGEGSTGAGQADPEAQKKLLEQAIAMQKAIADAEREGVTVRMKDIGRFRGVRANQLQGFGVVVGLAGTGDSQQTPMTATLIENAMKRWGTSFDATKFRPKNVAVVMVTAELPPFAAPMG